jgi:hypothetical protein
MTVCIYLEHLAFALSFHHLPPTVSFVSAPHIRPPLLASDMGRHDSRSASPRTRDRHRDRERDNDRYRDKDESRRRHRSRSPDRRERRYDDDEDRERRKNKRSRSRTPDRDRRHRSRSRDNDKKKCVYLFSKTSSCSNCVPGERKTSRKSEKHAKLRRRE